MTINSKIPEISKQIYKEDIFSSLQNNYSVIGTQWTSHQMEWCNSVYSAFKDHDKFLIVIYLLRKTLDFYSRNFIKLSFDSFYSKDTVEIGKFNIIEISKDLNMPKETVRRKIIELEQSLVLKRYKKKIIIDRSAFPFVKPINSIKRISRFLSLFSKILIQDKILSKQLTSVELEKIIRNNFSYVWKIYYEFQIPMLLSYKKVFVDLESFHIWGTCVVNQHLFTQKINDLKMNRTLFINTSLLDKKIQGLNAMSISDITGIPRATVVRKLKKLVKKDFLSINAQKHYSLTGIGVKKIAPVQDKILHKLSEFSTTIYNFAIL